MSNKVVGKDASLSGTDYMQTYQKLLRQKRRIDRELDKVQLGFLKAVSKDSKTSLKAARAKTASTRSQKYVVRVNNKLTLIEAIHKSMLSKKKMTMNDVLEAVQGRGKYRSKSKYLYTMINNKLNSDEHVQRVSRGVFVYDPPKGDVQPKRGRGRPRKDVQVAVA